MIKTIRSFLSCLLFLLLFCLNNCKEEEVLKPEENRFTRAVLAEGFDEPMEMAFLPNGNVVFIERKGGLKMYSQADRKVELIAMLPVNTKYRNADGVHEAEEGLMGIVVDPRYEENHWVYLYYADSAESRHVLARWDLMDSKLLSESKKILLEVPTQREECCHTGGGMTFDHAGNLYLTTGNNTSNSNSDGYSPLDERPGMSTWDDQRGSANTNDLRGKILRIHPEPDGTYTIPEGNLFKPGTEKTRPEIYTMGHRNPWRPTIDSQTGFLYWGEVGPDNSEDSERGPKGYDEFNQARSAGFFGWPYFIADNKAYSEYDFGKKQSGERFNPIKPVNNSPNNTGLYELPGAQKAMIWYPYSTSDEFPLIGSSGRSAVGGPVFREKDFKGDAKVFSRYYEGKWFIVDFMRGNILVVSMDEEGNYKSMESFLPKENFSSVLDMDFGPDGALYLLEYGTGWFRGNDNSRLIRIEYNAGNRTPHVNASADKVAGAVPLTVQLSSAGTTDFDNDDLNFNWTVTDASGAERKFNEPNPKVVFNTIGVFNALLTVTDKNGSSASEALKISAGNEPPIVTIDFVRGNQTFYYPGQIIEYNVNVSDREDGSLKDGTISSEQVAVTFDYLPEGFDQIEASLNQLGVEGSVQTLAGLNLISANDCKSCHLHDTKSVGPGYKSIAAKYKADDLTITTLASKIIKGGGGVWGDHAMSAHPDLTLKDARLMVEYILELGNENTRSKSLQTHDRIMVNVPEKVNNNDGFMIRASYRDRGADVIHPLAESCYIQLRNPALDPALADTTAGTLLLTTPVKNFNIVGTDAFVAYRRLDLTDVSAIEFNAKSTKRIDAAGGTIEIRLDSQSGKIIGKVVVDSEVDHTFEKNTDMPKDDQSAKLWREKRDGVQIQKINIDPLPGKHDVFFVFKNPKAKPNQILMQLRSITFLFNTNK